MSIDITESLGRMRPSSVWDLLKDATPEAPDPTDFVGEGCWQCPHKFHSLKECACGCFGDETQSREAWESQRADERWADRL